MNLMENAFRRTLPIVLALAMTLALVAPHSWPHAAAPRRPAPQPLSKPAAKRTSSSPIYRTRSSSFFGMSGHTLLMCGLVVCALGLLFGLVIYTQLKNMACTSRCARSPS